jgi:hypothetical protein
MTLRSIAVVDRLHGAGFERQYEGLIVPPSPAELVRRASRCEPLALRAEASYLRIGAMQQVASSHRAPTFAAGMRAVGAAGTSWIV